MAENQYINNNQYINRDEFDSFKNEINNRVDKVHSENQQILIEVARIGERIGNFNEKFSDIKISMDKSLESFKDDIQNIQADFMNNLKEPQMRLNNLKWTIIATICTGVVGAILGLILKG